MRIRIATLALVMSLFITTVPAFSHHSDVAYERTSIELKTATIVKVALDQSACRGRVRR